VLDIDVLQDIREGMEVVWETVLKNPSDVVLESPEREIHEAPTNAVDLVLKISYQNNEAPPTNTIADATTVNGGVCTIPSERYDDLTQDIDELEYCIKSSTYPNS